MFMPDSAALRTYVREKWRLGRQSFRIGRALLSSAAKGLTCCRLDLGTKPLWNLREQSKSRDDPGSYSGIFRTGYPSPPMSLPRSGYLALPIPPSCREVASALSQQ